MRADVVSLEALLTREEPDGQAGYCAPFHQRGYRWSRRRNWAPFWTHWTNSAEDASLDGVRMNFLGAIVCQEDLDAAERESPDDAVRSFEVLDGQHRILTAMMAAQALRLHALRLGASDLAAALTNMLFDQQHRPRFVAGRASYADQMAALRTPRLEMKPALRLDDALHEAPSALSSAPDALSGLDDDPDAARDPFEGFDRGERLDAAENAADDTEPSSDPETDAERIDAWDWNAPEGATRLRDALGYFFDLIGARVAAARNGRVGARADAAELAELSALANALCTRSTFVLMTLDSSVSPFDVFERLNNLGEPLSALDLVKNNLFRAAERGGLGRPALEALYRRAWRIFDDARNTQFWAATERRGRESRPAQDWFLRVYLSVRDGRSVALADTQSRMQRIAALSADDAETEIEALARGAAAFAEIAGHLDPGPHTNRLDALRRFARFAAEPVLVAMRMHLWSNEEATRQALALLESVAVRRFFTGVGSGRDFDVYVRVARVIQPGASDDGKRCVRELTRRLKAAQRGEFWPKDGAFRAAFATKKLANRNSSHQARDRKAAFRAIFTALEGAVRGADPSEPAGWRPETKTVEHLYPLYGREHWPKISAQESDLLETIGNLTLIDDELNKLMGQSGWAQKRLLIAQDTDLSLNAELIEHRRWRRDWGPVQIKERGRRLAQLAIERWPRPR